MACAKVVQVETANGIEFVNLSLVRRFVPGEDGTLELRFGAAETLVLTGASARFVLKWVTTQAQALEQDYGQSETAQTDQQPPVITQTTVQPVRAQKRVQLIELKATKPDEPSTPPLTPPELTLDSLLDSARLTAGTPSPTINRKRWTPGHQQ